MTRIPRQSFHSCPGDATPLSRVNAPERRPSQNRSPAETEIVGACLQANAGPFSAVKGVLLLGSSIFLLSSALARAAAGDANTEEDRMRAALRESTLQLRTAQADVTNLQTTQAALTEEKKVLTEKYEALKKQAVADRAVTDKTVADLQSEVSTQKASIARLNEALEKSKAEGTKAAQTGREAEARNARLTANGQALQRRVAELEAKNLALFLLGNEILTRYEDFSLGNAISAKEPFVGKTRTKLENLVQDYQDKLLDQRAKP